MKITRYLWINDLPKHCEEEDIRKAFQSHGKIQTIRIHTNKKNRGAIVAFIDCKSSTKAFEGVKTLQNYELKLEYCEANGEPGIKNLGLSDGYLRDDKTSGSSQNSDSGSSSNSISSNTSSFGSSLDEYSKSPPHQFSKKADTNKSVDGDFNRSRSISVKSKQSTDTKSSAKDKGGLNSDYRGVLVENLSQRSSDTSLREGLFHEFKKHGKITSVSVMGQGNGRHAIISFKRNEDMQKALEVSQGKTFFGTQMKLTKHNGYNYIDPDLCPPEHPIDEYHPKATKTLFVGKLTSGEVVERDLKKLFKKYGEIIDIDIKTQTNQPDTSFAFVQYFDISSVVRALKHQDNIKLEGKPVKLGFGKSQPSNCIWVGNLHRSANEAFLRRHFKRFGTVMLVIPDKDNSCALIQFEGADESLRAFTETRERASTSNVGQRMHVDYASNEYQVAYMSRLRESGQFDILASQDFLKNIADPFQTEQLQNLLISYTKYLGLLEDTQGRSHDRYDGRSDYDDCEDRRYWSRHRKPAYNDNYGGVDDDGYSDDQRHSRHRSRHHYDAYSSSRSPPRHSHSSHKYPYYDQRQEPSSSNTYYPHRRSPEPVYHHSYQFRSYTPSPSPSADYDRRINRDNTRTNHSKQSKPRDSDPRVKIEQSRRDVNQNTSNKLKSYDNLSPALKYSTKTTLDRLTKKSRTTNDDHARTKLTVDTKSQIAEPMKSSVTEKTVSSVVQPVDALSKLERERAKLLAELSMLTEDTVSTPGIKSVKSVVKVAVDAKSNKPKKKEVEEVVKSAVAVEVRVEPLVVEVKAEVREESEMERTPVATEQEWSVDDAVHTPVYTPDISTTESPSISIPRDPRVTTTQPMEVTTIKDEPYILSKSAYIMSPVVNSYKDSASDSEMEQINSMDLDVEKRIRELDERMNRGEQTVKSLDYSKFRIRKKMNDGSNNNGITTLTTAINNSFSCNTTLTSSNIFDVGYSVTTRDSGSTASEFIQTMLNQTKPNSYHLLSDSITTAPCTMLPFRTVDPRLNDNRSLFSKFGTSSFIGLSAVESKVTEDPPQLSLAYVPRAHTSTTVVTTTPDKVPLSPTTPATTPSTPITPCSSEPNQQVKSILKKLNPSPIATAKHSEPEILCKSKPKQESLFTDDYKCNPLKKTPLKPSPVVDLKRKIKSEHDDVVKKLKTENGPILDDSLFKSYPLMSKKKPKKPVKESPQVMPYVPEKKVVEKKPSKRNERIDSPVETKIKTPKTSKLITKQEMKFQSNPKGRPLKTNKRTKTKKETKVSKEKVYDSENSYVDDEEVVGNNGYMLGGDSSSSSFSDHVKAHARYDNTKKRKGKIDRVNREVNMTDKKRRYKEEVEPMISSDDSVESDNSAYWTPKTNKRAAAAKKKVSRATNVGKSKEMKYVSDQKSLMNGDRLYSLRSKEENISTKKESEEVEERSPPCARTKNIVSSPQSRHKPLKGPLKKRPITDEAMMEHMASDHNSSGNDGFESSGNVLEEVVCDDQHHMEDMIDMEYVGSIVDECPLPADVNSASQILLTMRSQAPLPREPDQQVQSVAEHLISLAQNGAPSVDHQSRDSSPTIKLELIKPEDNVTTYVRDIIDKVMHQTDSRTPSNAESVLCKKPKKTTSNITVSGEPSEAGEAASGAITICQRTDPITEAEEKIDDTASSSSAGKRARRNSSKSENQMQLLEETIDTVVKGSMSPSASDAMSIRSATEADVNIDETKSISNNSCEGSTVKRSDLSSIDDTMNDVINRLKVKSPAQHPTHPLNETHNSLRPAQISQDQHKPTNVVFNDMKPAFYQLTNNVGGITNLVLGIPSILTLNNLSNQRNAINTIVSCQNPMSNQLSLSSNKHMMTSLQYTGVSSSSGSIVLPSLSLAHQQNLNSNPGIFSKLSSLTPIMLQTPLRAITPALQTPRSTCTTFVSIAPGTSAPVLSSSLTHSSTTHISAPDTNLSKMSTAPQDSNYYLMMQRQNNQSKSSDMNGPGASIILSQLTHTNPMISPITPGYLNSANTRLNSTSNPLQTLPNGMATTCLNTNSSILLRPMNIYFPKFEEKDDWLKQNSESDWNYPIRWTGKLCLKNDEVFVQMHMLAGNEDLIRNCMNLIPLGQNSLQYLRIVQRMRLEPNQLEGLQRRLSRPIEFCTCLTLAGGDKSDELGRTSSTLNDNFIKYLQEKSAAGIINISIPGTSQNAFVIHIFPACDFADTQLKLCATKLYEKLKAESTPYLMIVITIA